MGILSVDNERHALKCLTHLILGADTVQQPVGDMLAGLRPEQQKMQALSAREVPPVPATSPALAGAHRG